MRRFLVLALTLALGMTALVAIPASAGSRYDDCTWTQTSEGRECLTDRELRELRDRDKKTDREYREHRDRDKYDDRDRKTDRERRQLRSRRNRMERDFWRDWDWDFLGERRTDRCECLSSREVRRLERLADDPDRRDRRQILRYLRDQDCFSDREFRQVRRAVRNADEAELLDIIRDAARCECTSRERRHLGTRDYRRGDRQARCECTSKERRHLGTKDIRRLDRQTRLDERTVRQYLGLRNGRDCVTRRDVRRLDRRADDLDYWDILDFLGGHGAF